MFDLSSGLPYFWILNGLPHTYPAVQDDLRCEVLVIGGGITGALCAHACAKAGLRTTVVDKRELGTGSTAASTALLQYELDTPLHELAERLGTADAVRIYHLGVKAVHELLQLGQALKQKSVVPRQSLQYASKRAHAGQLEQEHALRTAQGLRTELLSRAQTHQRFGDLDAVALLSDDAAEMDPYAMTHALLQDVVAMGGAVYDRTEIVAWERTADAGFSLRTRDGHHLTAEHLVMATGYESQRYLAKPVLKLHSTYAVASERRPDGPPWDHGCLIWETARPYLYLRTTPDGRVLAGGLDEPFRDPARRDALLERKTRKLVRRVNDVMPSLSFQPAYSWCGTFGESDDGLPYIDRDKKTGAWFVLGTGGNGIVFSQVGAHIVRDAILEKPNADARLFRFDR